jgi:hypothetical protein
MCRSSVAAFHAFSEYLFYTLAGPGRRDRLIRFRLLARVHSEVEKIVRWMPEILLAAEFRGLDRRMPE